MLRPKFFDLGSLDSVSNCRFWMCVASTWGISIQDYVGLYLWNNLEIPYPWLWFLNITQPNTILGSINNLIWNLKLAW
jgi:hypothetical protein